MYMLSVPIDSEVEGQSYSTIYAAPSFISGPSPPLSFPLSQVPQHTELAWLLGCRTPMGWLKRMTQWKVRET